MSSEVSDIDSKDQGIQLAHRTKIANALGMTVEHLADDVVWETVRPSWRAELASPLMHCLRSAHTCIWGLLTLHPQITTIYERLDKIRSEERKKTGKGKVRNITKRVNIGRKSDGTPFPSVYPSMLDTSWYRLYLEGHADEGIFTLANDPDGWDVFAEDVKGSLQDAQ